MGRMLEDVSKTILKQNGGSAPNNRVLSASNDINEQHVEHPCVLKAPLKMKALRASGSDCGGTVRDILEVLKTTLGKKVGEVH